MSTNPRSQTGQSRAGVETETVLQAQAPAFSSQEAEAIAQRAFDIQASAHPLDSERDQNFQLRAKDGSEWVLKIANPAENPALLDMQTQALLHIAQVDPSLPIPRVKVTPDGALFHEIDAADGRRFIVRVLSFLPGQLLDDATLTPGAIARCRGNGRAPGPRPARFLSSGSSARTTLGSHPGARASHANSPHRRTRAPPRRRGGSRSLRRGGASTAKDATRTGHPQRRQWLNTLVDGNRVTGVIDFGDLIHAPAGL